MQTRFSFGRFSSLSVKILSLLALTSQSLVGCSSHMHRLPDDQICKTRAYVGGDLESYINTRFPSGSPVRMAVVPFSAPENISSYGVEHPGSGNRLAWRVHGALLALGAAPIVEVFNRQDWPGKKEEFFTGNFGAIALAREAGYDLVMVGLIDELRSLETMAAYTKIIETESGITVWYGRNYVTAPSQRLYRGERFGWFLPTGKPSAIPAVYLEDTLAHCIADSVTAD